jgi:hypothetical protein
MSGDFSANDILHTIGRLLEDPRFRQVAQSLRDRYGSLRPGEIADTVAAEIIARVKAGLVATAAG